MSSEAPERAERFSPEWYQSFNSKVSAYMTASPDGGYVRYADYASLIAERDTLRAENERLQDALSEVSHVGHDAPRATKLSFVEWKIHRADIMQRIARAALTDKGEG